jgi:hypothetical protein
MCPVDPRIRRERGRGELERLEESLLQLPRDRRSGHCLYDEAEQDVVRIRVGPASSGWEQRRMRGRDRDELARLPDVTWMGDHRTREATVAEVVEETARVIEQLADGDRFAIRDEPRQPPFDGVVEVELGFGDELQHDRRDEGLGDARDPEPVCRGHGDPRVPACESGIGAPDSRRGSYNSKCSGGSVADELPGDVLECRARRRAGVLGYPLDPCRRRRHEL